MNFSDLTEEGLTFDSVAGHVALDHGVFTFPDPIRVKSPSSEIRISGGVDMNTEKLDMKIGITIPVAGNIKYFALLAGLPAAAVSWFLSKLLEDQIEKLSSVVYSLKGNIDDPKTKFVKLFDNDVGDLREQYNKEQQTE